MSHLLQFGTVMVNPDHIVKAEFTPPYAGGEPDEDKGPGFYTKPRKAKLALTLTSVKADVHEYDFNVFHVTAASMSEVVVLLGEIAEQTWRYLELQASNPQEMMTELDQASVVE